MGAGLLAAELLQRVDCAFSVDGAKPVGTVITRALGQTSFAFVDPRARRPRRRQPRGGDQRDRGRAEIVAALPLGRQPGGGSVNVAAIVGGSVIDRLTPAGAGGDRGVEAALHSALDQLRP